jgi:hypothetical protein
MIVYIPIIVIGILMTSECANISSYYTDSCCEILGPLSINTAASSTQGLTNVNTCHNNDTVISLRYPPSKYWKLYIKSTNKVNYWYNERINTTFFCKINDNNAVTEDCDLGLPLTGTILAICCLILSLYNFINMLYANNSENIRHQREYISNYTNPVYVTISEL